MGSDPISATSAVASAIRTARVNPASKEQASVAGILLAAGSSTRFGGFKLMHPVDGVSMVLKSAIAMREALGVVLVAVRPGSLCVPTLLAQRFDVIECPRAAEGMGGTLADAVAAVPTGAAGFIIALADMPFIRAATIATIAHALEAGATLAAPSYCGERGHPVGLAAAYRDELLALTGDAGARAIIKRDVARITLFEVDDSGVLRDIDTPADLG